MTTIEAGSCYIRRKAKCRQSFSNIGGRHIESSDEDVPEVKSGDQRNIGRISIENRIEKTIPD